MVAVTICTPQHFVGRCLLSANTLVWLGRAHVQEALESARTLLKRHDREHERLAAALVEFETLTADVRLLSSRILSLEAMLGQHAVSVRSSGAFLALVLCCA